MKDPIRMREARCRRSSERGGGSHSRKRALSREENTGRASCVVAIDAWKKSLKAEDGGTRPRPRLSRKDVALLSRPEKQAAILRAIVSDWIDDSELDAMLECLMASRGGGDGPRAKG